MRQFSGDNGYKLPTDHHELMALVAPRALLATGNTDFYWLSNRANYITARATQQVYNTFGIGDRFGFYIDGRHGHCATLPAQWPSIAAFVDKFLLGDATANTNVEVNPYPTLDYSRWTAWWGTQDPTFPNNWNPRDGSVAMSMTRPIDINSGGAVLAGYDLSLPGDHLAATVSLAGGNVQADVSCPDGRSYTLTIPLPDQTYSIPANDDSWFPSPKALGVSAGTGNPPAAPVFSTTDTTHPLNVRFHYTSANDNGAGGSWSPTVTVNYRP